MELEGNLILERRPARRWVSAVAVIVPVLACIAGVTWFIRAFVSPPTIAIPGPMMLAAAPPAPTVQAEPPSAPPPAREAPPAAAPPHASAEPPASPSFAALAAVPPAFPAEPPREPMTANTTDHADPARESPAAAAASAPAPTEIDAAPLADPVPLPRPRRQAAVAVAGPVPLPRPRPADETSAPVQASRPVYSRHSAE